MLLYPVVMTLGKLIQTARKRKGLTLQALADELGVSKQLVWQWERGDSDPSKHLGSLSKALETPVDYFYAVDGTPTPREVKIKLLSPMNQELLDRMIDTFLEQQEQQTATSTKRRVK